MEIKGFRNWVFLTLKLSFLNQKPYICFTLETFSMIIRSIIFKILIRRQKAYELKKKLKQELVYQSHSFSNFVFRYLILIVTSSSAFNIKEDFDGFHSSLLSTRFKSYLKGLLASTTFRPYHWFKGGKLSLRGEFDKIQIQSLEVIELLKGFFFIKREQLSFLKKS